MKNKFLTMKFDFTYFGFCPVFPWEVKLCEGLLDSKFAEKALEETFLEIIVIF